MKAVFVHFRCVNDVTAIYYEFFEHTTSRAVLFGMHSKRCRKRVKIMQAVKIPFSLTLLFRAELQRQVNRPNSK